jgi:hypothetical protein
VEAAAAAAAEAEVAEAAAAGTSLAERLEEDFRRRGNSG